MAEHNLVDSPFPWFGGKRRVAPQVWEAIGQVGNYVEPFAGSLAVLLNRPAGFAGVETANDLDGWIVNFFRAVAGDPDGVARWADLPVTEVDLFARHLFLNERRGSLVNGLEADPDFFDAKAAGWWVWGQSAWLGSGWCSGKGPWSLVDGVVTRGAAGGVGVRRAIPSMSAGRGVHRQRADIFALMDALASRLRGVRVTCGDWTRVVTSGALSVGSRVGVFLDPPYGTDLRDRRLYGLDHAGLSSSVRNWALDHGDDPRLRIVLAGLADEHRMPSSWRQVGWTANGSYQTTTSSKTDGGNRRNRRRETLWISPHCAPTSI